MTGVIAGFSVIAVVIGVGYVLGHFDALGANAREVLTKTAFYAATPALLFDILSKADLSVLLSVPLLVAAISIAVNILLFVLLGVFLRWGTGPTTLGAMCSSVVNAGNLGIPIAVYVLGDPSLVAPILLLQQLVINPVGLTVLDLSGQGGGGRVGLFTLVTTPFRTPIVIASLAGVTVSATGWAPPELMMRPIELIGSMAVPAVLLAFGISLRGSAVPGRGPERAPVFVSVFLKSFVMPFVAWAVGSWGFGLSGDELFRVVVLAALPAAQDLFTFASRYDVSTRLVRESLLLSTLITMPVLVLIAFLLS
ncbi:AEC family transporter [Spiractinospora alimapuensis]|uniref:AEC family transporter n=1 Tax=Spiractinospora alimapuensis TaxID=2820884 RepID=UPI001F48E702|nr:AEC family transporter [Spiractinospora alimapuensis]QVQ50049.1 AEC family transporter [Spiractinospora alimapuensis]